MRVNLVMALAATLAFGGSVDTAEAEGLVLGGGGSQSRIDIFRKQSKLLDGRLAKQYEASARLKPKSENAGSEDIPVWGGNYRGAYLDAAKAAAAEYGIPEDLLANAHCIVIVPSLKTAAFLVGGKYGKGYLSCRNTTGVGWSAPGSVRIEGGSVGFQIGGSQTDLVKMRALFVLSQMKIDELGVRAPVELPYSQAELASLIGVSRQTVNQLMQTLVAKGLVEAQFKHVRVLAPHEMLAGL